MSEVSVSALCLAVGRHGARSSSPTLWGKPPTMSMSAVSSTSWLLSHEQSQLHIKAYIVDEKLYICIVCMYIRYLLFIKWGYSVQMVCFWHISFLLDQSFLAYLQLNFQLLQHSFTFCFYFQSQGKAQFSFQGPPGKSGKTRKVSCFGKWRLGFKGVASTLLIIVERNLLMELCCSK